MDHRGMTWGERGRLTVGLVGFALIPVLAVWCVLLGGPQLWADSPDPTSGVGPGMEYATPGP